MSMYKHYITMKIILYNYQILTGVEGDTLRY